MRIQDKIEKIVNKPFTIDDLEKIADDYAIEFAEWVVSRAAGEDGLKLKDDVLEQFKQEKGL